MTGTLSPGTDAEQARLSALRAFDVLDTPAEGDFDDIVALAAHLCDTPIALVSLVDADRQWFKARVGLEECGTSRDASFCAHAMDGGDVMQVPDARVDPRFADNPLVVGDPYIRFYAGAPLVSASGHALGSLCVIDRKPRLLTPAQSRGLASLARHVIVQLELRQYLRELEEAHRRLLEADRVKDDFLARVTHELRTPLTSIHGYLEVLDDDVPPATAARFKKSIRRNADRLLTLVEDMLLASQLTAGTADLDPAPVDLARLVREAAARSEDLATAKGLALTVDAARPVPVVCDARRVGQALDRLLLNAITYTREGTVGLLATVRDGRPTVEVADTGVGFPAGEREVLFAPFRRGGDAERSQVQGVGLGLTVVKSIVDRHGGTLRIDSDHPGGTTVTLALPGCPVT